MGHQHYVELPQTASTKKYINTHYKLDSLATVKLQTIMQHQINLSIQKEYLMM